MKSPLFLILLALASGVLASPASARVFAVCFATDHDKTIMTDIFSYDGECTGGGLNWSCRPVLYTGFVQATDPNKLMLLRDCLIANTRAELEKQISESDRPVIRSAWLPAPATRPAARTAATSAKTTVNATKYGFCFINILKQVRPGTYHIPNHAYFSNVFQVPAARANSGAITGDTNRLLIRMLKLIQDRYGDGGPDQGGKIQSCQYEKTAEAAESARIGEQGTQKRSQGGARIIETLSTLGMPPA